MTTRTLRPLPLASLVAGGIVATLLGCGGGATPTPTPIPTPAVPPAPTPTPSPTPVSLDDLRYDNTMASTCSNPDHAFQVVEFAYDGPGDDAKKHVWPRCFPHYFDQREGLHHAANGRPLPTNGRTCGPFDILVVFEDNAHNRQLLEQNVAIPSEIKNLLSAGQVSEGLQALFDSYTTWQILEGLLIDSKWASKPLPFSFVFEVALTSDPILTESGEPPFARWAGGTREPGGPNGSYWDGALFEVYGVGQRFPDYDAVVLLDDIPSAGLGFTSWPRRHPVFYRRESSYFLFLDPAWLTPGLLGNELLRRNMPVLLTQYTLGPYTTEVRDGVVYNVTPIYNPRTGENIEPLLRAPEGKIPIASYYGGWADVDADDVMDCVDHSITPTADNVDGDLVPDRFDPDLDANNSAFIWRPAP